jgi:hypothetical protein
MAITNEPELIRETDLPATFQAADRWAIKFQNHHVRWLKAHVLLGVVGASAAQLALSLTERMGFAGALALCVLALLVTRILVQQRPHWERIWCRSRAAAEHARSLSWSYMMAVDPVTAGGAQPAGLPAAKAELETFIRRVREEWTKAAGAAGESTAAGAEVTGRMDEVRLGPYPAKVRLYLEGRVRDQIEWYQRKAAFNEKRRGGFHTLTVLCELSAAGIAIAILVALVKPPASRAELATAVGYLLTFIWPCLTGAAAASGWSSFRRYAELAVTYKRSADQLEAIRRDLEGLMEDTVSNRQAFARHVRDCEELLTRENAIWFSRRTV